MQDAMAELTRIVRETLGQPDLVITRETVASDVPGWDSVAMVDMILVAEERFGIRIGSREMDGIACAGDLADVIARAAG